MRKESLLTLKLKDVNNAQTPLASATILKNLKLTLVTKKNMKNVPILEVENGSFTFLDED